MFLVADVNILKIKDDFIGPSIAGENYAVAIYNTTTSSLYTELSRVGDWDLCDELGSTVDLKFVKPRKKSAATHQNEGGEQIESYAILWFHNSIFCNE